MKRLWSQEEIAILREHYGRLSPREFQKLLPGRSISAITVKICNLRLNTTPFRKPVKLQKPVGSEHLSPLGYIKVKVAPGIWRFKHHLLWEAHYGKKPRGILQFIDGDKTNISIANLREISRAENLQKNNIYNLPEDLQRLIRAKGTLTRMINNRRNHHEQH